MKVDDRGKQRQLGDVFYLILRRMRFPILLIISAFSVAAAGFTFIPGSDEAGNAIEPLTAFDAFYVVVYTATTIGFGEVPYPFNTAQRMWMVVTIFLTVACWSYSLFAVLGLLQDSGFLSTLAAARFAQKVNHLREPFYLICGAGETGTLVMQGLDHLDYRFVVVDNQPERLAELRLEEFSAPAPMVSADASQPSTLLTAGLNSRFCRGVVALAEDDSVNQAIAVTVRLMAPKVPVLARIRDADIETHVGVFGGDLVINPFQRFSEHLIASINTPQRFRLRTLLTGLAGEEIVPLHYAPTGRWIVCGYGRFGQEITKHLRKVSDEVVVVDDINPDADVKALGTKSDELKAAGIQDAAGLVVAHNSDTLNLAIGVTARALRHDIFIVTRQNQRANQPLFDAFANDLPMESSRIVAQEFLARITTPLLSRFLRFFSQLSEKDCATLADMIGSLNDNKNPEVWDLMISNRRTPAVIESMGHGVSFTVEQLISDPNDREKRLSMLVLMVRRGTKNELLPPNDFELQAGDRLLLAGSPEAKNKSVQVLENVNTLNYIQTGLDVHGGYLWRWMVSVFGSKESRDANAANSSG